jgi:hypothetical protein
MKVDNGRPKVGDAAMCLGTRPGEIPVDPGGNVSPGTGGLSVYEFVGVIPAQMVPKRLKSQKFPFAAGNNNMFIWAFGQGRFETGPLANRLNLRIDSEDPHHGFIEPDAIMTAAEYQAALAATRDAWDVDED